MQDNHSLGMSRKITRRDFINGVAQTAAASFLLPSWLNALEESEPYPPALTGLRGSNPGSFEVAHQMKDGKLWETFGRPADTREVYDLVVVGGGISGLAAAWFFRKATGPKTRILILDNHDDFGGHARRQEFGSLDSFLLTYGGSFAIESAAPYSNVAKSLIEELGIDVPGFENYVQKSLYSSLGLTNGFFFDRNTFGNDLLLPDPFTGHYAELTRVRSDAWDVFLKQSPLSEKAKQDLSRLENESIDYLPGISSAEKKRQLAKISYADFLTKIVKCDPGVLPYYQARPHSLYGAGIDAVPAQDAWGMGFPGFRGMNLDPESGIGMNRDSIYSEEAENYFFHFPDGNASVARMLVRKLIPEAISGKDAQDIVMARASYGKLDQKSSAARLRLSSAVVRVAHSGKSEVEIAYVRKKKAETVRAKNCVLACWHTVIPYICPELPQDQKAALSYAIKVPLMYARAAIRNWQPWVKLGIQSVYAPGCYFTYMNLPIPLQIGGYRTATNPDAPTVVCFTKAFCKPGFPIRQQHRIGRAEVLETSFETFERNMRDQLQAVFGPAGFDAARDITGIAAHRWPHGYAYQYNSLYDPFWLEGEEGPCKIARKPFGRISIANSDAGAYAYADSAIDQAHRAIEELTHKT